MARLKPSYAREYLKFQLRAGRTPQEGYALAGTVLVSEGGSREVAYVQFSEELVTAVGKALPRGLGPEDRGFIWVTHRRHSNEWKVYAYYLDRTRGTLLWVAAERPKWLKQVRKKNATHTKSKNKPSTSPGAA